MAVDSTKGLTASALAPVGPVTPSESDKALHSWVRRLAVASVLGGLALAALLIWTACEPSDHGVTVNLDGVAKLVAALLAATSCLVFGSRSRPETRTAWTWIGTSAVVWSAGQAIATGYLFANNGTVPFPSAADAGFLVALPIAAVGVLLVPGVSRPSVSNPRVQLDGVIVVGSLLIISWTTALGTVYHGSYGGVLSQAVGLGFPISDVIVATVAVEAIALADRRHRGALVLVLAGLACLTLTDSSLAYLNHFASFRYGTLVDTGRVLGFGLVALAPMWDLRPAGSENNDPSGTSLWQTALPFALPALAVAAAATKGAESHHLDLFVVATGLCVIAAGLMRQVLTMADNRRLTREMGAAITTLRANQVELVNFALHDSLTGLPNRVLFTDRIDHALARRASPTRRVAVLLCDLDSFKEVNDTLGHASGDEVLVGASDRFSSCVRPADTVARIGGDEFAILLDDTADAQEAAAVAERICSAMRTPFTLTGRDFVVKASVGIAIADEHDARSEKLIQDADVALYAAKDAGGDKYTFFEPRLGKAYIDRLGIQAELSTALAERQFFLEFEPVVELSLGRTVGVQAVLRWRHPRRGVLATRDFLEVAESSGVIIELGAWALDKALSQLREWKQDIPVASQLWVAVDVSARQLHNKNFIASVSAAIAATGLEPTSLHIQLSQSAAADPGERSLRILKDLKTLGPLLEIAGFGTGTFSLAYLRQLPIDGVNIDRAFVSGLGSNRRDAVIAEAIVSLAHALQLTVGAEGIQTDRQAEWLRTLGCDQGQGPYWSSPLSASDLAQWLITRS